MRRARMLAEVMGCAARRTTIAAALLAAPLAICEGAASAADVTLAEGAYDCPDRSALIEAVTRAGGHDVDDVRVAFSYDGSGHVGVVRRGSPGTVLRTFSDAGPTCAGVADAVVLELVLLGELEERPPPVAFDATAAPVPPAVVAPATPATPPLDAIPVRPAARASSLADRRASFTIDAGAALVTGVVAPASAALSAGARFVTPAFSVGLGGWWTFSRSFDVSPGSVDVSMRAGWIDLCATALRRAVAIDLCATPFLGVVHGEGHGFTSDSEATRLWAGVAAGVVARGPVFGPVGWSARVEGIAPVTRQGFDVDGAGVAYTPAPVGLLAGLASTVSIW